MFKECEKVHFHCREVYQHVLSMLVHQASDWVGLVMHYSHISDNRRQLRVLLRGHILNGTEPDPLLFVHILHMKFQLQEISICTWHLSTLIYITHNYASLWNLQQQYMDVIPPMSNDWYIKVIGLGHNQFIIVPLVLTGCGRNRPITTMTNILGDRTYNDPELALAWVVIGW